MIDLAQRSEAYEVALPYGLSVTVKPLTTAGMATAQAAARQTVEAVERQARGRTEAGLELDGLPDLSAEGERDGFYQVQPFGSSRPDTLRAGSVSSWRADRRRRRQSTSPR
jgi:hypothetical protein